MAIKKKPVEVPAEVPAEACTWRTIGGALKPGKGPGVVQIFEIRALSCKTYGFLQDLYPLCKTSEPAGFTNGARLPGLYKASASPKDSAIPGKVVSDGEYRYIRRLRHHHHSI